MVNKGRVRTRRRRGSGRGGGRRSRRGGSDALTRTASARFVEIPLSGSDDRLSEEYESKLFDLEHPPILLRVNFEDIIKRPFKHGITGFKRGDLVILKNDKLAYIHKDAERDDKTVALVTPSETHNEADLVQRYNTDDIVPFDEFSTYATRNSYACGNTEAIRTILKLILDTRSPRRILFINDRNILEPFRTRELEAIKRVLQDEDVSLIDDKKATTEGDKPAATAGDKQAATAGPVHVVYLPNQGVSVSKTPIEPTPTYLVPQTQPLPVTVTLAGVPFFETTEDFKHDHLGTKFFCMGVYGESSKDPAGKTVSTVSIEKRTALNPYTLADTTVTLFDRLYFLGTDRYAKGVQTYINQEMMTLMLSGKRAGTALTIDKLAQAAGVPKPFGGGGRQQLTRARRHRRKRYATRGGARAIRLRSAATTRRRARATRGGGIFTTARRALNKVAGTATKLADKATGYMLKRAVKRAAPRMLRNALKAGTEALADTTAKVLPNLAMGAASTAFAGVNSGATLATSVATAPLSVAYSYAMRQVIRKLTAIEPEEHRRVWGNQLQDYITYKGVHVGVPQQMYYETQDFRGTHVRHLTYHLKFTVDPMIKDDGGNLVLRHQTADYVPIVLKYEQSLPVAMAETKVSLWKQKTQALASMFDRATKMVNLRDNKSETAEDQTAKTLYDATTHALPMQAEAERHTSYVRLPKKSETDIQEKQKAMWHQLNRLAAQNNHLAQETMLHSLYSALHGRRLDLFFAVNFVDDAFNAGNDKNGVRQVFKTLLQGLSGLLAAGAARGALKQSGVGILLNLFTGGLGANAAALAAGVHDAENLLPRLCQLVQVCLQGILSPSYFLFPLASKRKLERLKSQRHFRCTEDEKNTSVAKGAAQQVQDVLLRKVMGKFPTWLVETYTNKNAEGGKPLTIGDLLKDKIAENLYAGPRVLFKQFSHNWFPLLHQDNSDTLCHFLSTPNLRRHTGLNSDGPGVVLAFEAGASYRKTGTTIKDLLRDAYVTSVGTEDATFKQARLRAMLFGNTHYASVEYETHVADQLLRSWATGASGMPETLFPISSDVANPNANKSFNIKYLRVTTPPDTLNTVIRHEATVPSAKAAGGAAPLFQRARKPRRRGRVAAATFDEFDDDDDDDDDASTAPPAAAPTAAPTADLGPQAWEQKAYDTQSAREMEEQLRVQTIALLLRSMRNRFFKPQDTTVKDTTLQVFLNKPYSNHFPHTYVVAVVPLRSPCTFHYDPDEIRENGPYVFTSTLDFHDFFKGGLQSFMKKVYAPCILHYAEVRDKVKGLDTFYKELRKMPRPPLLFHDYNAYRYDRVKGVADDPSAKFKESFEKYSTYVKQQRDARREEYNEQQRLMLEKRKKMLMARRMSELADEQHRLLTGQFTPGSRPGYVHDPYAALRWRPRRRDPRYYRRRVLEYDVGDGTNALYPDVDEVYDDEHTGDDTRSNRKSIPRRTSRNSSSSTDLIPPKGRLRRTIRKRSAT